jgi:hypothetical protein
MTHNDVLPDSNRDVAKSASTEGETAYVRGALQYMLDGSSTARKVRFRAEILVGAGGHNPGLVRLPVTNIERKIGLAIAA